jgi:hypothetical protein
MLAARNGTGKARPRRRSLLIRRVTTWATLIGTLAGAAVKLITLYHVVG